MEFTILHLHSLGILNMDFDQFEIALSHDSWHQQLTTTIQTHARAQYSTQVTITQSTIRQLTRHISWLCNRCLPKKSNFNDEQICARLPAVTDERERLLLFPSFLQRLTSYSHLLWMHSMLARGIVILGIVFGLSVSCDFIKLTLDDNHTTHNNTIIDEYNIDNNRTMHTGNNNRNIDDSTLITIQMIYMHWMYFALALGILITATAIILNEVRLAYNLLLSITWKQQLRNPSDEVTQRY